MANSESTEQKLVRQTGELLEQVMDKVTILASAIHSLKEKEKRKNTTDSVEESS